MQQVFPFLWYTHTNYYYLSRSCLDAFVSNIHDAAVELYAVDVIGFRTGWSL